MPHKRTKIHVPQATPSGNQKISFRTDTRLPPAFESEAERDSIKSCVRSLWSITKNYDPIIVMGPCENKKVMIDVCDGRVENIVFMPRLYDPSKDCETAIKDFIANIMFLKDMGWRAPSKGPERRWRNNPRYLEILVAGRCHERNPLEEQIKVNMRKDTPDPRDSAARTEYQAAIALRGFVDIDKDSIEVGEWKFTAEEALESLHHGVYSSDRRLHVDKFPIQTDFG
ncbi:hypothetical protein HBI31_163420 [Parastagonospora nodorum]|nr:hypothetical protein HBI31_163420 [Parastagonospora nodorum]KAH5637434.1 hypothetical protein HBI51_158050 [Parastagonospora nodorum]